MSRLKFFLIILFIAMLAPRIYKIIHFLDIGETVVPHTPGKCNKIQGIDKTGSEDMDIIPGTDIVLISNGLVFGAESQFSDRKGRILFYDLSQKQKEAKAATFKNFKNAESFNPHGISVWKDNKGVVLFVVSHDKKSGERVERFAVDVKTQTLTHLDSITHPGFKVLNDITAVGDREFYFTNFQSYLMGSAMSKVESYLNLKNGEVCHFGPKGVVVLDSGLLLPNGINKSPDNRYLYVSHIGGDEIRVYDTKTDGTPKLVQQMPVPSSVDNISVDPVTGDLWLGCHPVGWKIVYYMDHQDTFAAPSQVLKVATKDGLLTEDFIEVYADDGKIIAASSIALYHKGQLLIGSISHNAVQCDVKVF